MEQKKTKKGDYVEIRFTGTSNGKIFDSNIEEDLKSIDPKAKVKKIVISIGKGMVVQGLDNALEDKEVGKEYSIHLNYNEGFGPRRNDLMKTIPLSVFTAQKITPHVGGSFLMDNMLAKVIAISGARVITDFNNPLAGKDLDYRFKIVRFVEDLKEKAESFFEFNFRFVPEIEISNKKVIVKGPEYLSKVIENLKERFKEEIGADIEFKASDSNNKLTEEKS